MTLLQRIHDFSEWLDYQPPYISVPFAIIVIIIAAFSFIFIIAVLKQYAWLALPLIMLSVVAFFFYVIWKYINDTSE